MPQTEPFASNNPKRLKILISAYACEPNKGSEPGVGWNIACGMAKHHDIWVLTRANNREVIEAELAKRPIPGINFLYYDLPRWASWWKRGGRGIQLYYYLWQLFALRTARKAHSEIKFDLAHHVTFVKYWAPTFLSWLGVPFIWGPVGGGESAPASLFWSYSLYGKLYELRRSFARWLAEHDPLVSIAAKKCVLAIATTEETKIRLKKLGARRVEVLTQVGLNDAELELLSSAETQATSASIRFLSISNLLHWKGTYIGLRAFAKAAIPESEYWIIGDGPERCKLQALADKLGISDKVTFFGKLPRGETLHRLKQCDVFVHPSLHDSGGFVCLEAMGASKPVICLDLGGPPLIVGTKAGIPVFPSTPRETYMKVGDVMTKLANNTVSVVELGRQGRLRVENDLTWRIKCEIISGYVGFVQQV